MNNTEPRRATITISELPERNSLGIDVEFFPELDLKDDSVSALLHLVNAALEAINNEAECHAGQ